MITARPSLFALALAAGATALLGACNRQAESPAAAVIAPTELTALQTPPPDYPLQLACDGVGGTAKLSVTVGPEGKPTQVDLIEGSGSATLDQSALDQISTWLFRAATRNGQAISQTIQVPVTFTPPQPRPEKCFGLDAGRPVN